MKDKSKKSTYSTTFGVGPTFLKKKWSPETISSVCFDKKISHQTIYNYIYRERQLGGTLHRYLLFKRRRRKYGIKDYRGQIRNRVSIESRPEIVAERSMEIGKAI